MRSGILIVVCVAGLAITAGGCSPIFVKGPPPPCSQSRVAPWIDTGVAATGAVLTAGTLATKNSNDFGASGMGVVLFIPVALGYGISAIWGHQAVSGCRATAVGPH